MRLRICALAAMLLCEAHPALAQSLYREGGWAAMAADRRASAVGDAITVVVQQQAESSSSQTSTANGSTQLSGDIGFSGVAEAAQLGFGGGYSGRGEIRRSERLVAVLSVTVVDILPNGDFRIAGEQQLHVNGEDTRIAVRGRIRPADIESDNTIASGRIADAEIDYDGKGFVSRGARPGIITRIFNFLGLL
ncbi:flagellar basal body L-ring protein FlgH [Sphingosinithalassobacter portus]|uniref:flagellar basal body L-ring protein FlgH n=1 Tax=Stakelama portus TaxID=2676234 RepID=UPI000D6DCC54|nr:flagellar basal body L-ring protein FlgH [Sphingosinithalassobacter portus]